MTDFRILAYRDSVVESHPLAEGATEWKVGRAANCDIRLSDPAVSRVHVLLRREQDQFHFEDLGGANPILQNGQRVTRGTLVPGMPLVVGGTILYLDRVAKNADIRIQGGDASSKTRRYLDDRVDTQDLAHLALPTQTTAELVASFLGAPSDDADQPSGAVAMLDATMRWLRFRQGTIVMFVGGATFEVLASRSRDGSQTLSLNRAILDEIRVRRRAFLQPGTASGRNVATVAVPLGEPVAGAMVLAHPVPGVELDDELLRTAATLGSGIWARLEELRSLRVLREQVGQVRFEDNPWHAALAATSRLSAVCRELRRAADHALPIFLVGEDGTEKEDLARYAHASSTRSARPFVSFHAGIVPPARAEEELFGTARASTVLRPGDSTRALLRAQGGMLFLEEPELLPEHVQDRLQRVLSAGELGFGAGDKIPLDVRVVAASTEDPSGAIDRRALRPGLAELLTAVRIDIPPLRSAPADVVTLTDLILSEMTPAPDGVARTISEQTRDLLVAHPWPGNVRQLRRVLEAAAARAGNRPIQPRDLPSDAREPRVEADLQSLAAIERRHIAAVLEAVGGVKTRAAEVLGIAASTLYEKLRRYNLK